MSKQENTHEKTLAKVILVVDDSPSVRQVIVMTLKTAGYKVIEAVDGLDALKKLDGRKIHLIISDLNMPHMDGIELVKSVKRLAKYKFTPIIMLTTESAESKKSLGKAAGAKAWIVKPFKPEQLKQAVAQLVLPN